jgi:hypothetical protein
MRIAGLMLLFAMFAPATMPAQSNPYQAAAPAAAALQLASPTTSAQLPVTPGADFLAARRFNSRAPGATFMIVGGAAIVTGILVGGSGGFILVLGGIGVGAYGFYLYNR